MTSTPHTVARLFGAAVALLLSSSAFAQATPASERCAIRLASNLQGRAPSTALVTNATPQTQVDTMVTSPEFIEKFSRFVNASFNSLPGEAPAEDASYYLTRHILQNNLPWRQLFNGQFRVEADPANANQARVVADTNGMGYFRSPVWMKRYDGNELAGYRIAAAYRIMQNTVGLKLVAALNTEGVNADGRKGAPCNSCHYNNVFALDLAAKVLSRRPMGTSTTYTAPNEGPQVFLGGQTIANDKQMVDALIASENFSFNACRLAAGFLYGRSEFKCEGPVFDKCVADFKASGNIKTAVATLAKDASFCQ